jgi:hypothetical protein
MKQPLFPGDSEIDEIFKIFRYVLPLQQHPALAGSFLSLSGKPSRKIRSGGYPVMACHVLDPLVDSASPLRLAADI